MTKKTSRPAAEVDPATPTPFPIVGIGASAGGLEALQRFFSRVEPASGAAYVVVQHLDPTHKAMLAKLLRQTTVLPVSEVEDGVRVEPDHVYVIPPNKDLTLVGGALVLSVPGAPRGLRLPIDSFLRSLAKDRGAQSIAVVLSGMGSDATLGLAAIREAAGASFVQSPASAKFDGMPRSAIGAGLADVVAPADELPQRIAAYLLSSRFTSDPVGQLHEAKSQSGLERIVELLRAQVGHDFIAYKKSTLIRRIERRMGLHHIADMEQYAQLIRDDANEAELLFRELLIGVTKFFRDPAEWEHLSEVSLPRLIEASPIRGTLRAWVIGCSTGEEAYSLAMVLTEALERSSPTKRLSIQIFATDLDARAVETARRGVFAENIVADVSPERLGRFFADDGGTYRIRDSIRELVVFATHNVLQDPPFTKLDIVSCRNVLIYLGAEPQRRLIPLFHYSLAPGGLLFLGSSETVGGFTHMFAAESPKSRVHRRLDVPTEAPPPADFSRESAASRRLTEEARGAGTTLAAAPRVRAVVERILLTRFAPAAVLTDIRGDIVYVSGRTGAFLELPAGEANWNLLAMARDGLRGALTRAYKKLVASKRRITLSDLVVGSAEAPHTIDVSLEMIEEPAQLRGRVLVVFVEARGTSTKKPSANATARLDEERLAEQLRYAREEVRSKRDQMQASEEELKSSNEELQSTNEELQSTNEELTTSKEEMQSMNEELQTLNHELQAKVDELSRVSSDMRNLLDSTEIAILFLDKDLNVRRYTPETTTIFRLIPGDEGRPLTDLATSLDYPELIADAREVLRSLVFKERVVKCGNTRSYRVRIMPYRTSDHRADGVVITFTRHGRAPLLP